jgi:acetyl esterase
MFALWLTSIRWGANLSSVATDRHGQVIEVDSEIQAVLEALAAQPQPAEPPTLDQIRGSASIGHRALCPPPVEMASIEPIEIHGPNGPVPCLVNTPRRSYGPLPILVYYHGGGLMLLGADDFQPVCTALAAAADCIVVNVDYRLAPEHPFPQPLVDQGRAYAAVLRSAGVPVFYSCYQGTIHAFFTMGGAVGVANVAVAEAASRLAGAFA